MKVRIQVIRAASMKMTVFWDVTLFSLVEICPSDDGGNNHS
jgi:hypothetical protein